MRLLSQPTVHSALDRQDTLKTQNYISSFTHHIEQKARLQVSQQRDHGLIKINTFSSKHTPQSY